MRMRLPLILVAAMMSCTLEDQNEGVSTDDIIKFGTAQASEVSADNVSLLPVEILLGPDVDGEHEIVFKTDQGRFQGVASEANPREIKVTTSLKTAQVNLISDVKPNVNVGLSASITSGSKTFTTIKQINFKPAYPTQMFLTTDKQTVVPDQSSVANLTVTTAREAGQGKVSDELIVSVSDSIASGEVQVDVIPFVKTANERSAFAIRSLNAKPGIVYIITSIVDPSTGKKLKATRKIEFKN